MSSLLLQVAKDQKSIGRRPRSLTLHQAPSLRLQPATSGARTYKSVHQVRLSCPADRAAPSRLSWHQNPSGRVSTVGQFHWTKARNRMRRRRAPNTPVVGCCLCLRPPHTSSNPRSNLSFPPVIKPSALLLPLPEIRGC